MTTTEKSEAILRKLVELCNDAPDDPTGPERGVKFTRDWGGNTLTIHVSDRHTHVGTPDGTSEELIDQLYALLIEGRGLSWA